MELHVGCAMWTHAPWQGRYLPGSLSPRDRLRAYASWCNAVEGNTTFYAVPTAATVRSWAEQTAPDFRFVLKMPKSITHERRLADADDPLRATSVSELRGLLAVPADTDQAAYERAGDVRALCGANGLPW